MKKLTERHPKFLWNTGAFLIIFLLWEGAILLIGETVVPTPVTVIRKFFSSFVNPIGQTTLAFHILYSLSRVLVGYFAAAVSGIIFGLLLARFELFRAYLKPVFDFLRPIPPIAWIPLAVLWFGVGELPKYFLIWIAAFVAFVLNSYAGATRVDPQLIGAAKMLGATEKQVFTKIVLPATVPFMFTGAQIAISNSWMAVIGAEMVGGTEGVGWIISAASNFGNYTQVFVGMLAIAIIGYFIVFIVNWAERRLLKWNIQGK